MKINKTNNTNQMGSCTIFVYTWNINIKYVNKLLDDPVFTHPQTQMALQPVKYKRNRLHKF